MESSTANKIRILLVDDDDDLRMALSMLLKKQGFTVTEALNGKEAQTLITSSDYDLVLTDIRMPVMNGIELLNFVKNSKPMPVVLMTGFSEIMEAQDAFEIGADDFLAKPFSKEDLMATLRTVLKLPPEGLLQQVANVDLNYCRVLIEEFTSGSKLKVDLFLRLSEAKYLRVAKKDSLLAPERVISYKKRGLSYFYIKKEDFAAYVGFNLQIVKVAKDSDRVSHDQKLHLLKHASEALLQDSYVNGLNREKFNDAKTLVSATLETVIEDGDIGKLLGMLNSQSDQLYSHCLGVSVYASLMAKEVGWISMPTQFKVSLAGLLHDIGKKELDPKLLERPRKDWTNKEIKEYETHPLRGKEILSQIPAVPSDVALVALHHHENRLGQGFPTGLKKEDIHPLASLISLADRFCTLVLKNPQTPQVLTPEEAIEKINLYHMAEYEPAFLVALMTLFKVPIPERFKKDLAAAKKLSVA